MQNCTKALQFMKLVGQLKQLKRTGWVMRHVPEPETVASHMYRMAVMTMMLADVHDINRDKCVKMALVHDMAECIVGDIAPADNVSKEEKHRLELEAMERITGLVDEETGREIYQLWEEYERQETRESHFVKDIDRFDMILQAHEYEQHQPERGRFLQEFFDCTQGKFQTAQVRAWADELDRQRNGGTDSSGGTS